MYKLYRNNKNHLYRAREVLGVHIRGKDVIVLYNPKYEETCLKLNKELRINVQVEELLDISR